MIFIWNVPIGSSTSSPIVKADGTVVPTIPGWVQMQTINPQDNGGITVTQMDGTVLSIQPSGAWGSRPAGTNGQYEVGSRNGANVVAWNPNGGVPIFAYPIMITVV